MKRFEIDPENYNDEYYLGECDGYHEFLSDNLGGAPARLKTIWDVADVTAGMVVLDAGCGRGEILRKCRQDKVFCIGIDYSKYALRLAKNFITKDTIVTEHNSVYLIQSDLESIPLAANIFDRVIMSDVVEHIEPERFIRVLKEIRRVMKVNGELVIHTMPNLWYYRYGYPIFRFIESLRGNKLPKNPRSRFKYSHFHVNEQDPRRLKSALQSAGFQSKVWLYDYRKYSMYPLVMRIGMRAITKLPLIKLIFCDDIFAIGIKTHD
ncbi:MAG: Methyltransferase type 11 [Anaerolineae bacterium]|nr:MAG: Methyltransferase type 11 [Anaerolineae bacterium]